jgi:hypothetical protein
VTEKIDPKSQDKKPPETSTKFPRRIRFAIIISLVVFSVQALLYVLLGQQADSGSISLLYPTLALGGALLAVSLYVILKLAGRIPLVHSSEPKIRYALWATLHRIFLIYLILDLSIAALVLGSAYYLFLLLVAPPSYEFVLFLSVLEGFMYFVDVISKSYLLNIFGQDYKSPGIESMKGASTFGYYSSKLLLKNDKKGIKYLYRSLQMAQSAFREKGFSLKTVAASALVVDYIDESKLSKYQPSLLSAARKLAQLPNPHGLDDELENLVKAAGLSIDKMKFDIDTPPSQFWQYVAAISGALGVIGTFLAVIPDSYKNAVVAAFSSESGVLILLSLAIFGWYSALRLLRPILDYPISVLRETPNASTQENDAGSAPGKVENPVQASEGQMEKVAKRKEAAGEWLGKYVEGYMFSDVRACIEGKANFAAALALSTYSEILGGLINGSLEEKGEAKANNYITFLKQMGYKDEAGKAYGLVRGGLTHQYFVKQESTVLMWGTTESRRGIVIEGETVTFHVVDYFQEFQLAYAKLKKAILEDDGEALAKFENATSVQTIPSEARSTAPETSVNNSRVSSA